MAKQIAFLFLILLLIAGCIKNPTSIKDTNSDNISISWNSIYCEYNRLNDIVLSQICDIDFIVNSGSGNLKIEANIYFVGEGNSKSVEKEVEEGKEYTIVVPITTSGSKNCAPGEMTGSIKLTAGNSNPYYINMYCNYLGKSPTTFTIGDLVVTEILAVTEM